jgi:ABC-2 type transport system ATP-binding protein
MEPVIKCEQLNQFYGKHQVLEQVSFEIVSGCTGLLGPNGAGKSTLIKTILGQRPLLNNCLLVAGHDPAQDALKVRQQLGYMPETDHYLPQMNGLELVTFCGQLCGMARSDAISRAHEVLHFVGLGEERYREVDGYSTGMRQRVKLAAALVHGPKLLLLDEPTSGLDPAGRQEMLDLIDQVAHQRGVDVVFSSHILKDIEQTCDQVVVLNKGRVLFSGSRQSFQIQEKSVLHVKVKTDFEKMAQALREAGCQVVAQKGMEHLEVELPPELTESMIWKVASQQNLQVRYLAPAIASLEDAFENAVLNQARKQL